ncbi:ABC transporter related protein [Flexistipes sinusarabici DSM 4947]|uniref:ABC transporter related protein n=1 Tax=Flexistipes sinusarabici (strain ATCC 49648 / DSM 4947 / MAS 10) TaxID=717231 RepID=F8E9C9_FLESM|nr:energy-coupling factor ABC transporter ATP-binding protein [Flexistipes sinusarabici]AEI14181.1 ABC transporter related protein [Flexistipes sinusarabici DSM 4947]
MYFYADQLSLSADGKTIFHDISFELLKGSITCVYGCNGSGKTVLLKTLLGLIQPDTGEIRKFVDNNEIGACLQFPEHLIYHSTVEKEIMSLTSDRELADEVLQNLGLTGKRNVSPMFLSEGQKRLMFLMSLFVSHSLLFIDEPFTSLDRTSIDFIADKMKVYAGNGKSILYTTNRVRETVHADKIVKL